MMTEVQLYNKRVAKHEKRIARKKSYGFVQTVKVAEPKVTVTYVPQQQVLPKQTLWQRTKNLFGRIL